VQNTWTVTANAITLILSFCGEIIIIIIIIMCWFQFMNNVKKRKPLIPNGLYETIIDDIHNLNY